MRKSTTGSLKAPGIEWLVVSCRRADGEAIFSVQVENRTERTIPSLDLMLVCEYELDGENHRKTKLLWLYSSNEQTDGSLKDLAPNRSATYVLLQSHDTADLQSLAAAVSSDEYYVAILSNNAEIDRVPGRLFGSMLAGDK